MTDLKALVERIEGALALCAASLRARILKGTHP